MESYIGSILNELPSKIISEKEIISIYKQNEVQSKLSILLLERM